MTSQDARAGDAAELRRRAEEEARAVEAQTPKALSPKEVQRTLHELRVHQIELEMQNEELRRTQAELEIARARYFDLYDLAPVGYVVLSEQGLLLEVNFTAAGLLGRERNALARQPITRFIHKEDVDSYYRYRKHLFETGAPRVCELRMVKADGAAFWAHLEATASQDADGAPVCRIVISDTTERKRIEKSLLEKELQYHTLADSGRALIWTSNADKKCDYFNQPWLAFTGRSLEQELGDGWVEGVHPEDREHCIESYTRAFDRREPFSVNYRLRRHDGEFRWIRDDGTPRYDSRGSFLGYIGHCLDIGEQQRAEEELRAKEQLLSESQSTAHIGSWSWDLTTSTSVLQWSPETYRLHGVSPDTFVPSRDSLLSLIHEDDQAAMEAWLGACLAGEEPPALEFRALLPGGGVRYILARGDLVRDAKGEPVRMAGVAQDITERRLAEAALRASEERHRTILLSAMDGFWLVDVEGRLLEVNRAYCRMSGYTEEELLAMRVPDLEAIETASDVSARIQKMTAQGGDRFESRHRRKDGSVFDVEVSIQYKPVENGQFVAFLHDITERKRAEKESKGLQLQLAQAQKMESIGRLAGGVAHDFNNLLNVIMGYTGLALRRLKRGDPATKSLAEVQKAAERAAELTRQLLAFSRKQALHPRLLDLNSVIIEIEKLLRRLIREDINLEVVPGSGLGSVKADPAQINQILMNLAVNSRDAMPRGGKVIIETANVELDEAFVRLNRGARPGSYVMLAVRDTGFGMDAETLGRVFEPFFTTKEVGKGTGLGLSTVYGIVKQSDGYITVHSEPGQGAEFKVYLPRVYETPESVLAGEAEPLLRGDETILVAEDEPAMRELVREFLAGAGYRVLVARDVKEAIQIAMQHQGPLDLLLTDVVMPDLSGPQLAEHLQLFRPQMKVLYMSGYADALVANSTEGSGTVLINKPFTEENLLRRLRKVLEG